jgi:hypothetical protein
MVNDVTELGALRGRIRFWTLLDWTSLRLLVSRPRAIGPSVHAPRVRPAVRLRAE